MSLCIVPTNLKLTLTPNLYFRAAAARFACLTHGASLILKTVVEPRRARRTRRKTMHRTEYEHHHAGELPTSRNAMKNLRDLRVLRGELSFSGLLQATRGLHQHPRRSEEHTSE